LKTKHNKRRALLAGAIFATAIGVLAGAAQTASAADGDQLIVGGDFSSPTINGLLNVPGASTDFTLASQVQANNGPAGSMWDPGMYTVGTNPHDFHVLWVDWAGATDPMLFVNGFTNLNQKVLEVTVQGEVCETAGSTITFEFGANMANILPLGAFSDGGAKISVTINGTTIGSEVVLTNDPANVIEIVGSAPAAADGSLDVAIWNNGVAYSGNDFALDDITLTQRGDCEPPCQPTTLGVWFNYTGKYSGGNTVPPLLTDPKWHALPATPGGEHALSLRGFNKPYNPGADKGKGDWFVWKDLGTTCPTLPA
jgi:hypothetical protein